jgi:peptide/nickel transport system substrate-binding protein
MVGLLIYLNQLLSVSKPTLGGSLVEGEIGTPRFVNPLLATTEADKDLTNLIYSGLMRQGPQGETIPDLAEKVDIDESGLIYTFHLRPKLTWHDGAKITADDVVYTIDKIKDPLIKSPGRSNWDGVRVEKVDDSTVRFKLTQRNPTFLDTATLGILPKHLWNKFDEETFSLNQLNTESIGSGPYELNSVRKNSEGLPEYYDLTSFKNFALGQAKIENIRLRFYPNQDALFKAYSSGEIKSLGAVPAAELEHLPSGRTQTITSKLPRVFAVFLNPNRNNFLVSKEVRQALDLITNKQEIITQVLHGYGVPAVGPLGLATSSVSTSTAANSEQARGLLTSAGWIFNNANKQWEKQDKATKAIQALKISLATSDTPELKSAAELIKQQWEAFGIGVDLQIFEIGDLNQKVIRPRQYEALFFGEILGRSPDLYPFWHSSGRLDPGLNIALYTNITVDTLLEQARAAKNKAELLNAYRQAELEIIDDQPAIFVYAPYFVYLLPTSIKNPAIPPINVPSDRFLLTYQWYINTEKIWKIFAK